MAKFADYQKSLNLKNSAGAALTANNMLDEVKSEVIRSADDLEDYQVFAWQWLRDNPFSALFVDTGMGKTVIVLTLLDYLLTRSHAGKVLVIAPIKVATRVWNREPRIWRHAA